MNVGFLFNARRKTSDLRLGFALEGLLNPAVGFESRNTNKDSVETKYFGLNIHGSYDMEINKNTYRSCTILL